MSLYKINVGDLPRSSDVNQLIDIFTGLHDIGTITFAPKVTDPSTAIPTTTIAATTTQTSVDSGTHQYVYTFVTGYKKTNGALQITGETLASPMVSVNVASSGQQVTLSGIPTGGNSVVARNIYRTKAGTTTPYYLLAQIPDNVTTSYVDSTPDANLPNTNPPNTNNTGTKLGGLMTFDNTNNVTNFTGGLMSNGYKVLSSEWLSRSYTHLYQTSNQYIAASAWTKVLFGSMNRDNLTESVGSNSGFTAKNTGFYDVSVILRFNAPTSGYQFTADIYKNGVSWKHLDAYVTTGTTDFVMTGSCPMLLQTGDKIEVYVLGGSAVNIVSGLGTSELIVAMV